MPERHRRVEHGRTHRQAKVERNRIARGRDQYKAQDGFRNVDGDWGSKTTSQGQESGFKGSGCGTGDQDEIGGGHDQGRGSGWDWTTTSQRIGFVLEFDIIASKIRHFRVTHSVLEFDNQGNTADAPC